MNFFKPEDFTPIPGHVSDISAIANAKLEREGLVVYGNTKYKAWSSERESGVAPFDTHKALLINILPMEKCNHIDHLAYSKITNDGPEYLLASCRGCGEKFKLMPISIKGCE